MRHLRPWPAVLLAACAGAACFGEAGCGSTRERLTFGSSDDGKIVSVRSGEQFDVALGTIGPAYFAAPPAISSSSVVFLSEKDEMGVPTPGGYETQTFAFEAASAGQADIAISREMAGAAGFSLTVQVY